MSSAFTLFLPRDSGLHRLHPLTKLTLAASGVMISLLLPGAWPNYAVFGLGLLPLAAWGRLTGPFLRRTLLVVWPFALSLFIIQGLFWTNGTPLIGWGPLALKAEGVQFAAIMTGRILLLVGSFLLLSLSTRPDRLMYALTQRGFSDRIAYIILSAIQIIPRFQAKAETISNAQRARGLETEGRLWQRVRALLPLVAPLILGSLIDVEERSIALEARGFGRNTPKTSLIVLQDRPLDKALRVLLLAGVLGLLILRLTVWR